MSICKKKQINLYNYHYIFDKNELKIDRRHEYKMKNYKTSRRKST